MYFKNKILKGFLSVSLLFSFVTFSYSDIQIDNFQDIRNVILLEDGIIGGGPPSEMDIKEAAKQGIKTVIDLRRKDRVGDEPQQVQTAGMKYVNIPVTANTLSQSQVDEVAAILEDPDNRPALLHCASGNRVGALWALYLHKYKELNNSEAYALGIEKGLRSESMKTVTKRLLKLEN